jgi:hypothetical protein
MGTCRAGGGAIFRRAPGCSPGFRSRADPDGTTGTGAGLGQGAPVLPAVDRLDEITGISLHMGAFPAPGRLVSWVKLSPRTIQSGTKNRAGPTDKGNPYLRAALGNAAAAAGRSDTFPGERYRRLARRRGKLKALVADARSILVIIWHLLTDPSARYRDLGPGLIRQPDRQGPQDPQPHPAAPASTPSSRSPRPPDCGRESRSAALHRMLPRTD